MHEMGNLQKKPMDKQKATQVLLQKIAEWEDKPKSDGYEYEKNFLEVIQALNAELLQLSVGEVPKDRNPNPTRGNRSTQRTHPGDERAFPPESR